MTMRNNENRRGGGFGLATIIQIVFIVLKLTKIVSWSWLWVLAPTWIGFVIAIVLVIIVFLW